MRRTVLLFLFAVAVAAAGFVKGQGGAANKAEIVKYPAPGAQDAVGLVESPEARKVLDDFYQSKVLLGVHDAVLSSDADAYGRLIADRQVENDERFGNGEVISKAQVLANYRTGNQHMSTLEHDNVRLVAFGENTVVVTGHSTSTLHHQGKLSKGPRLLTEVWVKFDGRWQRVVHAMSDLDGGMEDRAKP